MSGREELYTVLEPAAQADDLWCHECTCGSQAFRVRRDALLQCCECKRILPGVTTVAKEQTS